MTTYSYLIQTQQDTRQDIERMLCTMDFRSERHEIRAFEWVGRPARQTMICLLILRVNAAEGQNTGVRTSKSNTDVT